MFIRSGAAELVASLLWDARCELGSVAAMRDKYFLPIAKMLLGRAAEGDWVLERHESDRCWVPQGHPQGRVHVVGQETAAAEGGRQERVVKALDKIRATLRECGCGRYMEQNNKLLDSEKRLASHPGDVHVGPRWIPPAPGGAGPNLLDPELGRWLPAI